MRMPRPPPPANALIITGKPTRGSLIGKKGRVLIVAVSSLGAAARRLLSSAPCRGFRSHGAHRRRRRTDEDQSRRRRRLRRMRVLGEEAVAWMDCLGAGPACRRDYGSNVEIAVLRRRRAD